MKRLFCLLVLLLIGLFSLSSAFADVAVRGYFRKDGTYVQPHYRSTPDSTPNNNWSTQGNVNPYTGKPGTRAPEPSDNLLGSQRPTPYSSSPFLNPYRSR